MADNERIKLYYQDKDGNIKGSTETAPTPDDKTAPQIIIEKAGKENCFKTINNQSIVGEGNIEVGGGGSDVIANPTLAGNEPSLSGIQVGDDKYKVITQQESDERYLSKNGGEIKDGPIWSLVLSNKRIEFLSNSYADGPTGIKYNGDNMIRPNGRGVWIGNNGQTTSVVIETSSESDPGGPKNVIHRKGGTNYEMLDAYNTSANPEVTAQDPYLTSLKINNSRFRIPSSEAMPHLNPNADWWGLQPDSYIDTLNGIRVGNSGTPYIVEPPSIIVCADKIVGFQNNYNGQNQNVIVDQGAEYIYLDAIEKAIQKVEDGNIQFVNGLKCEAVVYPYVKDVQSFSTEGTPVYGVAITRNDGYAEYKDEEGYPVGWDFSNLSIWDGTGSGEATGFSWDGATSQCYNYIALFFYFGSNPYEDVGNTKMSLVRIPYSLPPIWISGAGSGSGSGSGS